MHNNSEILSFSKLFCKLQFLVANNLTKSSEISIETGKRLCEIMSCHNNIFPPSQSVEVFGVYVLISWKYILDCSAYLCSSVPILKSNRNSPKCWSL